jgi:hypothetical protein
MQPPQMQFVKARKMKMEIPTHTGRDINKALEIIEAQALEIRELQAVIVRLREESSAMTQSQPVDFWAKRRMTAWKALPEPRMAWEDFKRTWKDD